MIVKKLPLPNTQDLFVSEALLASLAINILDVLQQGVYEDAIDLQYAPNYLDDIKNNLPPTLNDKIVTQSICLALSLLLNSYKHLVISDKERKCIIKQHQSKGYHIGYSADGAIWLPDNQ